MILLLLPSCCGDVFWPDNPHKNGPYNLLWGCKSQILNVQRMCSPSSVCSDIQILNMQLMCSPPSVSSDVQVLNMHFTSSPSSVCSVLTSKYSTCSSCAHTFFGQFWHPNAPPSISSDIQILNVQRMCSPPSVCSDIQMLNMQTMCSHLLPSCLTSKFSTRSSCAHLLRSVLSHWPKTHLTWESTRQGVRSTFSLENKRNPGAVGRMTLKITIHGKHKDSPAMPVFFSSSLIFSQKQSFTCAEKNTKSIPFQPHPPRRRHNTIFSSKTTGVERSRLKFEVSTCRFPKVGRLALWKYETCIQ